MYGIGGFDVQNPRSDHRFLTAAAAEVREVIGRAIFDAGAWDDFVQVLAGIFPGTCVAFQRVDLRRNVVCYDRMANIDPGVEASYRQYYYGVNPWMQPMRAAFSGTILVSERDYPARSFEHTEFYNDWLRPELAAATGLILESQAESLAVVGVHYSVERSKSYDEPLSELLHRIRAPLLRSMETTRLIDQTIDRERSAAALVACTGDIACVVDENQIVIEANAAAEREFQSQEIVAMRSGKLSVTAHEVNGWLGNTLRLLAQDLEPGATTRIFSADSTYQLVVNCLPRGAGGVSPFSRRQLFLAILRNLSGQAENDRMASLAAAYGLTPAERRLCEVLSLGYTPKEAAEMFGIAPDTARQRLKAIFNKTDTHRQSELVRLFSRLL